MLIDPCMFLCCFMPIFCTFSSGTSQNVPDVISRLLRIGFVRACEILSVSSLREEMF